MASRKSDIPVHGSNGGDDRKVAYLKIAGPVRDGQRHNRVAGRDLLADPLKLSLR